MQITRIITKRLGIIAICLMCVVPTYANSDLDFILDTIDQSLNAYQVETGSERVSPRQELAQAVAWGYEQGLTRYATPDTFMASQGLRRDEAAAFFVRYANLPDTTVETTDPDISCDFDDLGLAHSDLTDEVRDACEMGFVRGNGRGNYFPDETLTNEQALAIAMRMTFKGIKDDRGERRSRIYYAMANDIFILENMAIDREALRKEPATRGDVIVLLHRLYKGTRGGPLVDKTFISDVDLSICADDSSLAEYCNRPYYSFGLFGTVETLSGDIVMNAKYSIDDNIVRIMIRSTVLEYTLSDDGMQLINENGGTFTECSHSNYNFGDVC